MPASEVYETIDLVPLTPDDRQTVVTAAQKLYYYNYIRLDNLVAEQGNIKPGWTLEYDHILTVPEILTEINRVNQQYSELLPVAIAEREEIKNQEHIRIQAAAEAAEREKQSKAANLAREQAAATARTNQIADWVTAHGTDSQKSRLAANLLPESEILTAIENEQFVALADFPHYSKLNSSEVCTCERCEDDYCHVDFRSYPADSATEAEFETLTKIKNLMPDAEIQLREHEGVSTDCTNTVTRKSIRITVKTGVLEFTREYACP
jgi:hypothetical protein